MKFPLIFLLSILLFLLIFGQAFLSPWALFVLDFTIPPFSEWQKWYATTLQWHLVDMLNYIFWYEITTKIYYLFVYGFGVYFAYKLAWIFSPNYQNKNLIFASSLFFIILNPFSYERILTQPWILLGIFSLGLCISYLIENVYIPQKYALLKASLFAGLGVLFFPHASLLIGLIGVLYMIFYFKKIEKRYFIISPLIILLLNINWLVGDLLFKQDLGTTLIQTFDRANIEGFVGNSLSWLWSEITHLLLYWFWWERFHILTPEKVNPYWFIFWFVILGIISYWAYCLYKKEKRIFYFLSILWGVSYILALGISSPLFWFISEFLYANIWFYIGMREPQKWLWLTMIVFCIFFLVGLWDIDKNYIKNKISNSLKIILVFVFINAWNPLNLWSYGWQLFGITYPNEYFEARDQIKKSIQKNEKVLIFPWHSYMACDWTGGKVITGRTKELFYPLDTIVSDNLEIETKYSNSTSPLSKDIENYIKNPNRELLTKNNIRYIINLKTCGNFKGFQFLEKEVYLQKIIEKNRIDIYKIQ